MEEKSEHSGNPTDGIVKVVLFGPESTGKTTLAEILAKHYNTVWVAEYMREYLEKKWEGKPGTVLKEDLLPIAHGQERLERQAMEQVNNLLICDTDLLELKVYSQYYYDGYCPEYIRRKAKMNGETTYLLTYVDTPWEADILRDRPHDREKMFRIFEKELKDQGFSYHILKGNVEERFHKAVQIIDQLLKNK